MDKPKQQTTKTEWTTRDLAEAAGVSTAFIRRLLLDGKMRGRKIGRDWVVSNVEARRWLEQRER